MTAAPLIRHKVFISYSHHDAVMLARLQVHLKRLERDGLVTRWDDTDIRIGERWREKIRQAIGAAKIAILLVSPDFLASDFIAKDELPPLLLAAEKSTERRSFGRSTTKSVARCAAIGTRCTSTDARCAPGPGVVVIY